MLSVLRLSRRRIFPPGGEEIYRHMARLGELGPGTEFLVMPCGRGVTTQFLAELTGASGSGVDPDANLVQWAEARAKQAGLATQLHYERASLADLPYKDDVFDVALGEVGVAAAGDPVPAVRELARVTKPMGKIVLAQLTWTGNIESEPRKVLIEHLGVTPFLVVEWKQMLREAGFVELAVEDWSDAEASFRQPSVVKGLTNIFSWRDKLSVFYRAARRWGWRELPAVVARQRQVVRLLLQERVLGLSVIRGIKWQDEAVAQPEETN